MKNIYYCVLFFAFFLIKCSLNADSERKFKSENLKVNILDTIFLKSTYGIPFYQDYSITNNYFLSIYNTEEEGVVVLNDSTGNMVNEIIFAYKGPNRINRIETVKFGKEKNQFALITNRSLSLIDFEGNVISSCELPFVYQPISGYGSNGLIIDSTFFILGGLDLQSREYQVGSKEFVLNAKPIKKMDLFNCEIEKEIGFGDIEKTKNGSYQSTFYDPVIMQARDYLYVAYPRISVDLYKYDLSNFALLEVISLSRSLNISFAKPIEFNRISDLGSRFNSDNQMAMMIPVGIYLNGILIDWRDQIGMDKKKSGFWLVDISRSLIYNLVFAYPIGGVVDFLNYDTLFLLPDVNSMESDPIGFPIIRATINLYD